MPTTDLRGQVPVEIISIVDAWGHAQNMNRIQAVTAILEEWAMKQIHAHIVFERVARGNPLLDQARRGEAP